MGFLVGVIVSTSLLTLVHCVQVHYGDPSDVDPSAPSPSRYQYVDPSDMSSYSHSMQRNVITTNRQLQHDAHIDEITEKRTIYHAPTGIGDTEDDQYAISPDLALKAPPGGGGVVEVLEKNVKYKEASVCGICPTVDEASIMIYTKRIIASLLNQMNVRNHIFGPNEAITIDLQAELSHEDFAKLDRFINGKINKSKGPLEELDAITELAMVTDIVGNLLHYVYPEPTITWMEYVQDRVNFQYLCSLKFWINLTTLTTITVLVLVLLRRASTSTHPFRFIFYIFLLFFIISCVTVFRDLYEAAKAENHARLHQYDRIPKDCNYNDFGVFDSIGYYIRIHVLRHKDQCVDYHQQIIGETYYHVHPVEAVSETISKLIFHPMEYIGEKSGKFFGGIIAMVPFWLQPILLILVFVFGFLAIFRYRITSPFISIEPAPAAPARPQGRDQHFLEGSPAHQAPPPAPRGQAIIERPPGEMVRTSTGIDIGTNTDDLEDYINGRGIYHEQPEPLPRIPTNWTLFQKYFWIIYDFVLHYLNILLRQVPDTSELELDDNGDFRRVERDPELELDREEALEIQQEVPEPGNQQQPEIVLPEVVTRKRKEPIASTSSSSCSSSRNTPIFDRPHLRHAQSHSSNDWVIVDDENLSAENGNESPSRKSSSSSSSGHRPRIINEAPGTGEGEGGSPVRIRSPLGRTQDSSHDLHRIRRKRKAD